MPISPADRSASSADAAAIDHVVTHLFDSELERIAYGRGAAGGAAGRDGDADRARSAAAVREIARRAAEHPARSGELVGTAPDLAVADRARGATTRSSLDRNSRPWWRRPLVPIGAAIAAVIAITSIPPTLSADSPGPSSLDIFLQSATADELELQRQLVREGLRLSVAPRVIAHRDGAQVLAYRLVTSSGGERPRNDVCLLLDDEHTLGSPVCAERGEVEREGMVASLAGASGTYVVTWGPTGGATLSVLRQNQVAIAIPTAPAADAFLFAEPSADDLLYAELVLALHPDDRLIVRVLSSTPSWSAVGALIARADTGLWSYCVHLFERAANARTQLGARVTCAGLEPFEDAGLLAQARATTSTLSLEWLPDGTIVVDERAAP